MELSNKQIVYDPAIEMVDDLEIMSVRNSVHRWITDYVAIASMTVVQGHRIDL